MSEADLSRSFSKSQVDKLGDALRKSDDPSEDELDRLQRIRLDYDAPMAFMERVLREELSLEASSRLKTANTIVDKLRRERTRLSSMQDIAGIRIVLDMTMSVQDQIGARIRGRFPEADIIDRRRTPSHGYRALHLVPAVSGFPVEVQIRTVKQDLWAQVLESLADRWGRGIRYGLPPDEPDAVVLLVGSREVTRREFVEDMTLRLSPLIASLEEAQDTLEEALARGDVGEEIADSRDQIREVDAEVRVMLQTLAQAFARVDRP